MGDLHWLDQPPCYGAEVCNYVSTYLSNIKITSNGRVAPTPPTPPTPVPPPPPPPSAVCPANTNPQCDCSWSYQSCGNDDGSECWCKCCCQWQTKTPKCTWSGYR